MKTLGFVCCGIVFVVLFVAVEVFGCPKSSSEFNGTCTYDLAPADSGSVDSSKWVSDEKPPRTTTGEWQTGKFKVMLLPAQSGDTEIDNQISYAQTRDARKKKEERP